MRDINLYDAYNSRGGSIRDLFDRHEEGFCVPMYQREYTWEEEHINQFFDDLVLGIREFVRPQGDNATTFLGTVILTQMVDDNEKVSSGSGDAEPTIVQFVVDGQQRISTIALLAIQLSDYIQKLSKRLPDEVPYSILTGHCEDHLDELRKLYSMRLGRNSRPPFKPKIIHTRTGDQWTFRGEDSSYKSPVAHYIAKYIRGLNLDDCHSAIDPISGARVRANVTLMNRWIAGICSAHSIDSKKYEQFPVGKNIITPRIHRYVLGHRSVEPRLVELITRSDSNRNTYDRDAAALYQLFLFSYYVQHRCGLNRLEPRHEEWGFDMFQALNATGTPLTAMETFLPIVMKYENVGNGTTWESTPSSESMNIIDSLFEVTTSNQDKNRRVNELLTAFSLCYEGKKLSNKFSFQRSWLNKCYLRDLDNLNQRRTYIKHMAEVANFYRVVWYMEDSPRDDGISALVGHQDNELCSMLVQYLRQAHAQLVAPILARYFGQYSDHERQIGELTDAIKACAAFFTIWRSAHSTAGLDDIYRRFFQGSNGPIMVDDHTIKGHQGPISVADLKDYFSEVLKRDGLDTCEAWMNRSEPFLLYSEIGTVCRFVLFVSGHDRLADEEKPGLTKSGKRDVCNLLNPTAWRSNSFRSIEHVAPQNPPDVHVWDPAIYSKNRFNQIGNLLLLPADINNRVSNQGWAHKYFHYRYVGQRSSERADRIRAEASDCGVNISSRVAKMLSRSAYNCTIEPITLIGVAGGWNAEMIDRRTNQLKEIAWERLSKWLNL